MEPTHEPKLLTPLYAIAPVTALTFDSINFKLLAGIGSWLTIYDVVTGKLISRFQPFDNYKKIFILKECNGTLVVATEQTLCFL